jgi:CRISPR-associated protein Cas1
MKKLLNTLFITTQGAYLFKDGETVTVKIEDSIKLRVPIHTIGGVVCFGAVGVSPPLMAFCAENAVGVSFLSEQGRFYARVQGYPTGNVLLRREQYRRADEAPRSVGIAKCVLKAKFANARSVLGRALRDHEPKISTGDVRKAVDRVTWSIKELDRDMTLDQLRGLEGDTARSYFGVFDHLIVSQKDGFQFRDRNRRPPMDNVNCLLSFLYTLLMHDVRSALESSGLDSAVGFLHRDRPGRPGLALDMMEEFRPVIADRLVLSLINLGQVNQKGFKKNDSGSVVMDDDTRKTVLTAYQTRKQEEITHPFINERIFVGLLFHVQAMLLARHLRGDLDGYPAYVWR